MMRQIEWRAWLLKWRLTRWMRNLRLVRQLVVMYRGFRIGDTVQFSGVEKYRWDPDPNHLEGRRGTVIHVGRYNVTVELRKGSEIVTSPWNLVRV